MIPESTLRLARDMLAFQARALAEHRMLKDASEQAEGAEAVGKAALAAEWEQIGKVLSNYTPRIMKHVGEIEIPEPDVAIPDFLKTDEPPPEAADLIDWTAPPKERHEKLQRLFMEAKQSEEIARSYGGAGGMFNGRTALEWLRKAERIESGIQWNRGRLAEQL